MVAEINLDLRPNAWLLDFGKDIHAAVGTRVLLQVIDNPKLYSVPCTPQHCRNVFSWQNRLLPVLDMALIFGGEPQSPRFLAIAGYQEQPGTPTRFGSFLLSAPPVAITVGDDQSCPLPEHAPVWEKFALSCFGHQSEAVPILHLGRIFSYSPDV